MIPDTTPVEQTDPQPPADDPTQQVPTAPSPPKKPNQH
jgi:hypothetical protein